ncbi:major Facilitator Superfamily protein [Variibacter gotjawalensis]|uniref:Major Facilitator Superfamily protein n=1 Tax=Variibacter gotjawalensis TaxID=1333996 RepID=A0A0S3PSG1_9BRAD|nr:MFS transporter [Variibacter gotjawalensis]NIK49168.1 MFS family permease [Variibacter gotjawalensis]RZS51024.1 MFS transporter [Variibacter gotjawalensis]BAT58858.1 major Facilitator Superfamily protein [Variibacter gotjawalensis]
MAIAERTDIAARETASPSPPSQSQRGLDWFVFSVADIQTGFGPFIVVYLTTQKWTQTDIGWILTIGAIAGLLFQIPGGALVDWVRNERAAAAGGVVSICFAALLIALSPVFFIVVIARVIHAAGSCILGPALAAISLGLVGHARAGERLGRNARFAAIGNGLSAAVMGALGYYVSSGSVLFVTALLAIPALIALSFIRSHEINPIAAHGGSTPPQDQGFRAGVDVMLRNKPLIILAVCIALFQLANASMLPLVATSMTRRLPDWAPALIAACIVLPQLVVAAFSPWVGRQAQAIGRKPLLLVGFLALPIRGLLLALVSDPILVIAIQIFDAVSAAIFGVLTPLIIADVTRGTGRFNLAQGVVGTAVGIGASLSGVLAGYSADHIGNPLTFIGMAGIGVFGLLAIWAFMPETRELHSA